MTDKNNKPRLIEEEKGMEESNLLDEPLLKSQEFYGVSKAYGNSAAFIQSPPEENKVSNLKINNFKRKTKKRQNLKQNLKNWKKKIKLLLKA